MEDTLTGLNLMEKPRIMALNKIDLLLGADRTWDEKSAMSYLADRYDTMSEDTVLISSVKKWGIR